jgi:hypothetical protein
MMVCDNLELYYGRNIRNELEKLLNTKFADDEKDKNMDDLFNRISAVQKRY